MGLRSSSPGRVAVRCAIFALTLVLGVIGVRYGAVLVDPHRQIGQTDLLGYYSAAHLVLEGHGGDLYNLHVLQRTQEALIYPSPMRDAVLPYLAPPYLACLLAPLALLSYSAAYPIWLLVNGVMLLLVLWLVGRPDAGAGIRPLAWAGLVAFVPCVLALAQGQVSFLILLCLTLAWILVERDREALGGACLALAALKPPYILPFLVVLVVWQRWRALGGFTATAAGLGMLSIWVAGRQGIGDYLSLMVTVTRIQGASHAVVVHHVALAAATNDPHVNYSLAAFVQLLLPASLATLVVDGASLLLLGLLVLVARRETDGSMTWACAAIVAVLINPHVLAHDLVILLLPVGLAMRHETGQPFWFIIGAVYVCVDFGGAIAAATHIQVAVLAVGSLAAWLFHVARAQNAAEHLLSAQVASPRP